MSVRMQVKVWERSKHSGSDLLMLIAIADFADENGVAYPAVATLAKKCRMTPRSANRVMAELRKSGELMVRQNEGPRGTNLYQINLPLTEMSRTPDRNVTPDGIVTLTEMSRTPDVSVPKPLSETSDEPSVNHQEPPVIAAQPPVSSKAADPCPHQAIIDLYHQTLPASPEVKAWNDTRKAKLRARWKEDSRRQSLDWWGRFFGYIAESDFLTGKTSTPGRRPFTPNLEWIVTPANFVKIIEGTYHEGAAA